MRAGESDPPLNIFPMEEELFPGFFLHLLVEVMQLLTQERRQDLTPALVAAGSLAMPTTAPGQGWAVPDLT